MLTRREIDLRAACKAFPRLVVWYYREEGRGKRMRFIRGSRLPGTSPRGGRKELSQVINDENVEVRFSTRDAVEENQGQLRRGRDGRRSGVSGFFFS
jgi:hypothetical protein